MNLPMVFSGVVLVLLSLVLLFLWRLVRSPLPLEVQQALEKRTEDKLSVLKDEWSKRLGSEVQRVWDQVQGQVRTAESSVGKKLEEANRTYAQVREELGKLKEATEQVEAVGRNVASLQELLRAPKMRGGFGEFFLADLLTQIVPADFYSLQYEFSGGERVDAVIRLGNRLVPLDAKFPLEQFRRLTQAVTEEEQADCHRRLIHDVKQHIDAVAEKYIRPDEGTFDFALMYIPAENVYYQAVLKDEGIGDGKGIFQHAIKRRVIPVSPNSLYAYLQVILLGLRGFAVEQRTKEILSDLIRLQQEFTAVKEDFDVAGKQLRYAVANFEKAERHLGRFEDRLGAMESPGEALRGVLPAREPGV
jgi:DNA recombination protein RmuC